MPVLISPSHLLSHMQKSILQRPRFAKEIQIKCLCACSGHLIVNLPSEAERSRHKVIYQIKHELLFRAITPAEIYKAGAAYPLAKVESIDQLDVLRTREC